jgi:hypothetical protein
MANHGLTHIPHNLELDGSVINLMFTVPDPKGCFLPRLTHDLRGTLDYMPIASIIPIVDTDIRIKCTMLPKNSEEEKEFLANIVQFFPLLNHKMLMAVPAWQGFSEHIWRFFTSYLVGRGTRYLWDLFSSDSPVGSFFFKKKKSKIYNVGLVHSLWAPMPG